MKVGPNETIEPVKGGIINGAFTTEIATPRVGEVLKRKKIDKLDLISRNETVDMSSCEIYIEFNCTRLRLRLGSLFTKGRATEIQN